MVAEVENLIDSIRERLKTEEMVRIPASIEEYFEIANESEFKIEYHEGEIIAMGKASFFHEVLVGNLIWLLKDYYRTIGNHFVTGSNIGVMAPERKGGYSPDVVVIEGQPVFRSNSVSDILNPLILIEVLSNATIDYDLSSKLLNYKKIPSLKQIIFVNQYEPEVMSYTRTKEPNVWLNIDYLSIENTVIIDNLTVPMTEIYDKIEFVK